MVAGKSGNKGESGKKVDWGCKGACVCVLGNTWYETQENSKFCGVNGGMARDTWD